MDRLLVYPSQQPTADNFLQAEKNKMIALGYLAQGVLGTSTVADGFNCIPTVPASLAVQIGAGSIFTLTSVDATAYGVLPVDLVDQIVKQGINMAPGNLTLTPPPTSGQSINYLIQAELSEVDTGSAVLPYFNSANPLVPFSGPNGSGASQPTARQCTVTLQAKAGTAATAGTQVTPTPDAGFVGLWVVTVANGATALTSSQISVYSSAPFINLKLPQLPAWVQGASYAQGVDSGTANQMVITLNPAPTSYNNLSFFVRKVATVNTGAMTAYVKAPDGTSLGTVSIVNADGSPLSANQMAASFYAHLVFDGSSLRFMNGVASTSVGALTASSGEGINVSGSAVVSLNYPSLAGPSAGIANTDLLALYSQLDAHHRGISFAAFVAAIQSTLPAIPTMATLAEHLAGTTTVKAANPAGVLAMINELPFLQSPNGYLTLPNGWIVQLLQGPLDPANVSEPAHTLNWPIPFPTACLHAQIASACNAVGTGLDFNYVLNAAPTTSTVSYYRNWQPGGVITRQTFPYLLGIGY